MGIMAAQIYCFWEPGFFTDMKGRLVDVSLAGK